MSVVARVDAYQRRHRRAGFPIAVLYKLFDDSGTHLAALVAYYGVLSTVPLLLLASTALSVLLRGDAHLQQQVLSSALRQFPVVGTQLGTPERLSGGTAGVVIGIVGSLYGGLGVSLAAQNAMNVIWGVPRNSRPNPIKARLRGLALLALAGTALLMTSVLSAVAGGAGSLGGRGRTLALLVSVLINAAAFTVGFRLATTRRLSWRDAAPGAVAAALLWQLLQSFGASYVGHVVKGASATNAVFALFLGLLAFFYLAALAVIVCAEANAVRVDGLWPRALLTPLTDDVDLTAGDRLAYSGQARAQRAKGFEQIDVTFHKR